MNSSTREFVSFCWYKATSTGLCVSVSLREIKKFKRKKLRETEKVKGDLGKEDQQSYYVPTDSSKCNEQTQHVKINNKSDKRRINRPTKTAKITSRKRAIYRRQDNEWGERFGVSRTYSSNFTSSEASDRAPASCLLFFRHFEILYKLRISCQPTTKISENTDNSSSHGWTLSSIPQDNNKQQEEQNINPREVEGLDNDYHNNSLSF